MKSGKMILTNYTWNLGFPINKSSLIWPESYSLKLVASRTPVIEILSWSSRQNVIEKGWPWWETALTHWGLVMPYGDRELCQHWLRQWLVAWRHQAITWTNIDLSSVRSCGVNVRTISQEIPQLSIIKIGFKTTSLKFLLNLLGVNESSHRIDPAVSHSAQDDCDGDCFIQDSIFSETLRRKDL